MPTTVHITDQGNQTISGIKTFTTGIFAPNLVYNTGNQTISGDKIFKNKIQIGDSPNAIYSDGDSNLIISGRDATPRGMKFILADNTNETSITFDPDYHGLVFKGDSYYFINHRPEVEISSPFSRRPVALLDEVVLNTGNQTISGIKTFIGNFNISGNTNADSVKLEIAAIQKTAGVENPVNITTFFPHGYQVGDSVIVEGLKTAGCNDSTLTGTYTITEITSISGFRYSGSSAALSTLYAVGCGFPAATVKINTSKISLSNLNYYGYNNLVVNNPPFILSDKININNSRTPASSTSSGLKGDICWDSNYLYICVANNTWKRFSGFAW